MRRFRFHPAALADYQAATEWYAARSSVAPDFVDAVEEAVARIRESPEAWPPIGDEEPVRRFVLRRFPYSVVYLMEPSEIVIVAVAHARRRPWYWVRRLTRGQGRHHG